MTPSPMERALELAREARGKTRPNPPVGAVLVKDGRIVGEGRTQPPGGPHAEIVALRAAGPDAEGSTLYVTLEPCSHWGRTPPCADALIQAGIAEAHVAIADPNPLVQGQGVERLRAAGIPVTVGEGSEDAADLIHAHARYSSHRLPLVTVIETVPPEVFEEIRAGTDLVLDPAAVAPAEPETWLRDLALCDITSILVHRRSPLAASLLAAGLVDRLIAPADELVEGFVLRKHLEDPKPHNILVPANALSSQD